MWDFFARKFWQIQDDFYCIKRRDWYCHTFSHYHGIRYICHQLLNAYIALHKEGIGDGLKFNMRLGDADLDHLFHPHRLKHAIGAIRARLKPIYIVVDDGVHFMVKVPLL
jgi:hypothetical protein